MEVCRPFYISVQGSTPLYKCCDGTTTTPPPLTTTTTPPPPPLHHPTTSPTPPPHHHHHTTTSTPPPQDHHCHSTTTPPPPHHHYTTNTTSPPPHHHHCTTPTPLPPDTPTPRLTLAGKVTYLIRRQMEGNQPGQKQPLKQKKASPPKHNAHLETIMNPVKKKGGIPSQNSFWRGGMSFHKRGEGGRGVFSNFFFRST